MAGQITGLKAVMEALENGVAIDRVLVDRDHDTSALRAHFHVGGLFAPGEIRLTYSHYDRLIVGSAVPGGAPLLLGWVARHRQPPPPVCLTSLGSSSCRLALAVPGIASYLL